MFANRVKYLKWDFLQLIDFFLVLSWLRLPVPAFLTIPRGSDFKQGNEDKELKEGRLIIEDFGFFISSLSIRKIRISIAIVCSVISRHHLHS